jgi:hypothetical protein
MSLLRRCQLLEASKKLERYVEIVNVDGYIFPIEILDLKISIGSIKPTTNVYNSQRSIEMKRNKVE